MTELVCISRPLRRFLACWGCGGEFHGTELVVLDNHYWHVACAVGIDTNAMPLMLEFVSTAVDRRYLARVERRYTELTGASLWEPYASRCSAFALALGYRHGYKLRCVRAAHPSDDSHTF